LVITWNRRTLYVDPVGGQGLFKDFPPADLILVAHGHGDHYSASTIEAVRGTNTIILAPPSLRASLPPAQQSLAAWMPNGAVTNLLGLRIEAVPAYNLTSSFHPKGAGNGYVLTLGGKRIYISGDTEDTPEMRALKNIDVAFLCMNLPFTMTVDQAASALREFRPRVVYPYHFRNRDGALADLEALKAKVGPDIEIRVRKWY
jgi:L-ascorbate metabolism protein UlaG (beta-lactamase superfamily)